MSHCSLPQGIRFGRMSVAGDGSCFFRSLAQTLAVAYGGRILSTPKETAMSKVLRQKVVECIEKNACMFETFRRMGALDTSDRVIRNNMSLREYVDHMKKHRTYATTLEIMVAATLFDISICLMSDIEVDHEGTIIYVQSAHNLGTFQVINAPQSRRSRRIFLLKDGLHYEPILPKSVLGRQPTNKIPTFPFLNADCPVFVFNSNPVVRNSQPRNNARSNAQNNARNNARANVYNNIRNDVHPNVYRAMTQINRLKSSRTPLATQLANLTKLRNSINNRGARTMLDNRLYDIKRNMGKYDVSDAEFQRFVNTLSQNAPRPKKFGDMIDNMLSNRTKRLTNNQRAILNVMRKNHENWYKNKVKEVQNMLRKL